MSAVELLQLLRDSGSIVSSNDCSEAEIVCARARHWFWVDEDGFGYVYRPRRTDAHGQTGGAP